MTNLSRGAFLRRAGAGAAGFALMGGAVPALGDTDGDLANVRLVAATKRLSNHWYTAWLDSGLLEAGGRRLVLGIRRQEQDHYRRLATLLGATAPVDDDFTFTLPKGALRSQQAAQAFAVDLERLVLGVSIGAASRTGDQGVAELLARITAADGAHLSILDGFSGSPLGPSLPQPLSVQDASAQLAPFLS
jgi:hypothetical protein